MISQFFILSARGDSIINRDCNIYIIQNLLTEIYKVRNDLIKNTPEIFFRTVKLCKGDQDPIFNIDGVNYFYMKKNGLYLVCTTRFNPSPAYIMELLNRISKVIKDFCGILSEEAIRKNFVLIYEILEEMIDFGQPQLTSTELIKPLIVNEPIAIKSQATAPKAKFSIFSKNTTISSTAINKPINVKNQKSQKDQIFIDILFNNTGFVINSSIDGCIQMKSYLKGNPTLRLALNEDLQIGKSNFLGSTAVIDDCNFHEQVNTSEFDLNKTLKINPPEGEFTVMNYRVTGDMQPPFRVVPSIEEQSTYKLQMSIEIKSMYPKQTVASFVIIKFNVPKQVSSVYNELKKNVQGQKVDYDSNNRIVEWTIKKFGGEEKHELICKASLQTQANIYKARKEFGPINVSFEIPMYNMSNLQIKYLKIESQDKNYNPYRWVKYVTQSSSFVCRT